jgi:hypothetical protein
MRGFAVVFGTQPTTTQPSFGIHVVDGINPVICTRPNMTQCMRKATRASGVRGVSLDVVEPKSGKATLKINETVPPDKLNDYLGHLRDALGLESDSEADQHPAPLRAL